VYSLNYHQPYVTAQTRRKVRKKNDYIGLPTQGPQMLNPEFTKVTFLSFCFFALRKAL